MIKLSSIGICLMIFGAIITGVSIAQWFFRFPDVSQLALGVGIGMCFTAFGYIHSWMRHKDKEDDEREEVDIEKFKEFDGALDAMRIYQVDELEKINSKMHNKIK